MLHFLPNKILWLLKEFSSSDLSEHVEFWIIIRWFISHLFFPRRRIIHPGSGRTLELYSNQPGLQFSTGNDLPDLDRKYPPDFEEYCDCMDTVRPFLIFNLN